MTFNYFNPGRTGWGKKISGVFNTLEIMGNAAEKRIEEVTQNTDYYLQFTGRNYRTPAPSRADLPARVEDALEVFMDRTKIVSASIGSDSKITFTVLMCDSSLDRPIISKVTTSSTSGVVYYKAPNGNTSLQGALTITSDTNYAGTLLFQYTVEDGVIYIKNFSKLGLTPGFYRAYKDFSLTNVGGSGYTCNKRSECVIVSVGYTNAHVSLNGTEIVNINSLQNQLFWVPLYLRKGDKITGSGGDEFTVYRVNYLTQE